MVKPPRLHYGDTVATISPSWGCAGTQQIKWKYELGVKRLQALGLNVVAAPHSLRGTAFLEKHPEARAEDLIWAFENPKVKAIIANIGGNDAVRVLPFLSSDVIQNNPKILCGYSDIMALHLYCHHLGLTTFYGDNLLTTIAESEEWHPYSQHWFKRVFFDASPIGIISPSVEWSYTANNHTDPRHRKVYIPNDGYQYVQGNGIVRGRLFGGHGGLSELSLKSSIAPTCADFNGAIFFFEDIPEIWDVSYTSHFFDWLGSKGFLHVMNGIIIGKNCSSVSFEPHIHAIRQIVSEKYHLPQLPIICDVNFGHSSPMCILPYGVETELNVDNMTITILESGVV